MYSQPVSSLYRNTAADSVTSPKDKDAERSDITDWKKIFSSVLFPVLLSKLSGLTLVLLWCALFTDISREFSGFVSEVTWWLVLQPEYNAVRAVVWLPAGLGQCHWQPSWSLECCQCRQCFAIHMPSKNVSSKFLCQFSCIFKKVSFPFIIRVCPEL